MKFAPIPPTALLGEYSSTLHLCLAHVLSNDRRQVDYYKERSACLDDYVILDNGAYELGRSFPFEHVLKIAQEILPDELVLPDVYLDGHATLRETHEAFKILEAEPDWWATTNLMAVPQGATTSSWMACLAGLIHDVRPDVIGIPVIYETKMGRGILIKNVLKYLSNDKTYQPDIHLLGWDGDLYKLHCYARDFPIIVRSIDSAKPFYFSRAADPVTLYSGRNVRRPEGYFNIGPKAFDPDYLDLNLDLVYMAAEGHLDNIFI